MSGKIKEILVVAVVLVSIFAIAIGGALIMAALNPESYQQKDTEIERLNQITDEIIEAKGIYQFATEGEPEDGIEVELLETRNTYLSAKGIQSYKINELVVKNSKTEIITTLDENWQVLEKEEINIQRSYTAVVIDYAATILIVEILIGFIVAFVYTSKKEKKEKQAKAENETHES